MFLFVCFFLPECVCLCQKLTNIKGRFFQSFGGLGVGGAKNGSRMTDPLNSFHSNISMHILPCVLYIPSNQELL